MLAINSGAGDVAGNAEVNKRDKLRRHGNERALSGFAIKISEKVEMTLREQENERHCRTLDLQAMYDGFDTEKSRTTSDECH